MHGKDENLYLYIIDHYRIRYGREIKVVSFLQFEIERTFIYILLEWMCVCVCAQKIWLS